MRELSDEEFNADPEYQNCSAMSPIGGMGGTNGKFIIFVGMKMFLFEKDEVDGEEFNAKQQEMWDESKKMLELLR